MSRSKEWEAECRRAVVRGDADAMRRAVELGLPLNLHVFDNFRDKSLTPLHYAIHAGVKPAVVAVLIEAGADVNARAGDSELLRTPLMYAASLGRLDLVTQLLEAGADIVAKDSTGGTALASAGNAGKSAALERVIRKLLDAGAKPDAEDLVASARNGSPAMIRMLVEAGANVNEVSRWGTPLHLAVEEKRLDLVEALLETGANPTFRLPDDFRNFPGISALDLAVSTRLKKIIPILEASASERRPIALPTSLAPEVLAIPEVWKRLKKVLTKTGSEVKKSLKRAASEPKLRNLEDAIGTSLPDDVRASYLLHDGQKAGSAGLIPEGVAGLEAEYEWLCAYEILASWKAWKELVDRDEFEGLSSSPDPGIREDWWNPGWIPIAEDGAGNSICVDLAPIEGGTRGQIILMDHESPARPRLAGSFAELLTRLLEHLEQEASET